MRIKVGKTTQTISYKSIYIFPSLCYMKSKNIHGKWMHEFDLFFWKYYLAFSWMNEAWE